MKEGWEYKKLKDIATFTRGLTYSKNDEAEISNNIVLRSNNVDLSTGKLNFDELKYLKSEFSIPEEKRVKKGSLLMCMSNGSKIHLGKVALINEDYPYAFGGFMALVTPNEELNPQFFHYSLSSPEYKEFIKKLSEGANINNIKVKELELFTIPIPPLSEQQSIVDYLDSAFAKIDAMKANAEKALNEAKALFQASLKEMLEPKEGWEEKKLGEMSEIQSGFAFKSTQFQKRGEFQVIRMGNVRPGIIRYNESPVFIDSVDENTIEKSLLKVGDMIITQTGSRNKRDYGFTVLIDKEKLLLNQRIARIRVVNTITNKYLLYYSWTDYFRDQYFANEGGTVGQGNVGIDAIRYAVISYPSLSEQQSIVATLDSLKSKVDRLQANYEKISQECDALKQSILRQVFE